MTDALPNSWVKKITDVIAKCFTSLGQYLKALMILITLTFVELLIAFLFLDVDYPLLIALIGALIDALPILGISALLLPWAIYSAITGELGFGIALVVLYLIMTVVRQLVEPKVVSSNIGTHPFITLLCMYLGFKVVGIAGLLIGPILMIIFKNVFSTMFKTGYFKNIFVLKKEKKTAKETSKE
jgi:sporulation integral membrane protein YtvI